MVELIEVTVTVKKLVEVNYDTDSDYDIIEAVVGQLPHDTESTVDYRETGLDGQELDWITNRYWHHKKHLKHKSLAWKATMLDCKNDFWYADMKNIKLLGFLESTGRL